MPVSYLRNGKEYSVDVILKKRGDVVTMNVGNRLGAELATLDKNKARQLGINGGVVVKSIAEGGAIGKTRMQEGFIITSVNGQNVTSVEELTRILANIAGPVRIEGIYPGYDGTYTYPLNLEQ